LEGGASFSKN
jgi:SpoVK/Ycf46/Vps4 family AAA+-type ATPase